MKRLLFVIFLLPSIAEAQIITTIAGGGTGGDGSPATAANITLPWVSRFDIGGNFYFLEGGGYEIKKINTSGIITTIAGTGVGGYNGDDIPATAAELNGSGLAFDPSGNLCIADGENNRVRKIDLSTGIISTIAGNGIAGYGGDYGTATAAMLHTPTGICFDKNGNLYIADQTNYRIRKVSTSGIITTYAGIGTSGDSGDGGPATNAQFILLMDLRIDYSGNLYIDDWNAGRIRKVNTSGIISTFAGTGVIGYNGDNISATTANIAPDDIAFNGTGELYISDDYYDHSANVYVCRIRMVDNNGIIHTVAGNGIIGYTGDGGLATDAEIDEPGGVSLDTCGNLFISQVTNPCIRKVAFNPNCIPAQVNNTTLGGKLTSYPNPAHISLTISTSDNITSITITNLLGQTVYAHDFNSPQIQINISNLPSGMYLIKINGTEVRKFVKE